MMTPSCSVSSVQSPCVHTFGKRSKYAARYFAPSGSFQKPSGIEGNGAVQTSSPFSPRAGLPVVVEDLDRHAEPARLDLAAPHRQDRRCRSTKHDDDVGAARDRGEVHVAL